MRHQVVPMVTMLLHLTTGSGESRRCCLQTNPSTLLHLIAVLEAALASLKSNHARRILRNIKWRGGGFLQLYDHSYCRSEAGSLPTTCFWLSRSLGELAISLFTTSICIIVMMKVISGLNQCSILKRECCCFWYCICVLLLNTYCHFVFYIL